MVGNALSRTRRWVGAVAGTLTLGCLGWAVTPGLPVIWAPYAKADVRARGQSLFEHEWTVKDPIAKGDGLGPVFNGKSCVACHFQGGVGGGGETRHNVVSYELLPTRERPELKSGLIHAFATSPALLESFNKVRDLYPVVKGGVRVEGGCQITVRDFDPLSTQSVNSTALFGAGWIDRLSGKTIYQLGVAKSLSVVSQELNGQFSGSTQGRPRILPDGRVGKFGWKAQFATLEEFVAAACANEVGLGNPRMSQASPIGHDCAETTPDLDRSQFTDLVAYVDTLPKPVEIVPTDSLLAGEVARGRELFKTVGCAACHTPDIGGVEGVYSDFLLHRLTSPDQGGDDGYSTRSTPQLPLPDDFPLPDEWKTPPLWGVADSAPYFHDGGSPTLESAILRHRGDGDAVLNAYKKLEYKDRKAVVAFLQKLKAPTNGPDRNNDGSLAAAR